MGAAGWPWLSVPVPPVAPPELREQTLVLVKPDAVQRRLVGDVIRRFERRGFKLVAMKLLQVPVLTLCPPGGPQTMGMDAGGTPWVSPPSPRGAARRTGASWTSTTSSCGRSPSTPRSSPT